MSEKPLIDFTDAELLNRLFVEELGNELDPARPDGYVEVTETRDTDGSVVTRKFCGFPPVLTDLNAINALELKIVSRQATKRRVFRERLECLCGDTILHADARKRTLALIKTLEILRLNPSA